MKIRNFALAFVALVCGTASIVHAEPFVAQNARNDLVIMSVDPGEETIVVEQYGDIVVVRYDNEFDGDNDLVYYGGGTIFRNVRHIWFYGDDDKDVFLNDCSEITSTQYGGGGDDILIGGEASDWLYGEEGEDSLIGRGSDDWLDAGQDRQEGRILGGPGADALMIYPFEIMMPGGSIETYDQEFRRIDLGGDFLDGTRVIPITFDWRIFK